MISDSIQRKKKKKKKRGGWGGGWGGGGGRKERERGKKEETFGAWPVYARRVPTVLSATVVEKAKAHCVAWNPLLD